MAESVQGVVCASEGPIESYAVHELAVIRATGRTGEALVWFSWKNYCKRSTIANNVHVASHNSTVIQTCRDIKGRLFGHSASLKAIIKITRT